MCGVGEQGVPELMGRGRRERRDGRSPKTSPTLNDFFGFRVYGGGAGGLKARVG